MQLTNLMRRSMLPCDNWGAKGHDVGRSTVACHGIQAKDTLRGQTFVPF